MENIVTCPFGQNNCSPNCALYMNPNDLNETVKNKLASIGVIDREKGICAIKNISLCMNRSVFEKSISNCK